MAAHPVASQFEVAIDHGLHDGGVDAQRLVRAAGCSTEYSGL
jgi:hypothetical protein